MVLRGPNFAVLFVILGGCALCASRETLRFGFISPTAGPYGYRNCAAATTMAIEKAKRDGLWKDVDIE